MWLWSILPFITTPQCPLYPSPITSSPPLPSHILLTAKFNRHRRVQWDICILCHWGWTEHWMGWEGQIWLPQEKTTQQKVACGTHTLFYKSYSMLHLQYVCALWTERGHNTHKSFGFKPVSQETPYWSTARVCYRPPWWERRMTGWLTGICTVYPASYMDMNQHAVHLPRTPSSSFSSLIIWLDLSFLFYCFTAFLTGAVERVSDWLRVEQIPRYNIAACQSLCVIVESVCVCLMRLWSDVTPCLNSVW